MFQYQEGQPLNDLQEDKSIETKYICELVESHMLSCTKRVNTFNCLKCQETGFLLTCLNMCCCKNTNICTPDQVQTSIN